MITAAECSSKYDIWPWQNTVQALACILVAVACIVLLIWAIDRWL